MTPREIARTRQIDTRLDSLRVEIRAARERWLTANAAKMKLEHELGHLLAEREDLLQGQLILEMPKDSVA